MKNDHDTCHEQYYNLHVVHDFKYTFGFYILLILKLYFNSVSVAMPQTTLYECFKGKK